jgi:hypothetical protein
MRGLARTPEVIAAVVAVLTRQRLGPPMGAAGAGLDMPDLAIAGEPCEAWVTVSDDTMPSCRVVDAGTGEQVAAPMPVRRDGRLLVTIRLPAAGVYRVAVKTGGYSAVTALIMALPPGDAYDGSC